MRFVVLFTISAVLLTVILAEKRTAKRGAYGLYYGDYSDYYGYGNRYGYGKYKYGVPFIGGYYTPNTKVIYSYGPDGHYRRYYPYYSSYHGYDGYGGYGGYGYYDGYW